MDIAPIVLFVVLAGLPVLNAIIFRVSAVFLFTSIAIGNFLVLYLSDDVILALNAFSKDRNIPMIVRLVLLLTPIVLTLFVLRKSLAKSKFIWHLIPLIGCGLSVAVLTLPLLPSDVQGQIFGMPSGDVFKNSQDLIISITAVMVLMLMWRGYNHTSGKHGKKHR
jgi:hypothetical protein